MSQRIVWVFVIVWLATMGASGAEDLEIEVKYLGEWYAEELQIEIDEGQEVELLIKIESNAYPLEDIDLEMEDEEESVPNWADLIDCEESEDGFDAECILLLQPDYEDAGEYEFWIIAEDSYEGVAFFELSVIVHEVNRPPFPPEDPEPDHQEIVFFHEGSLELFWECPGDPDNDEIECFFAFWKAGERDDPLYEDQFDQDEEFIYVISDLLEVGEYQWQITVYDLRGGDSLESEGEIWELNIAQWCKTWFDYTEMEMYLRKPGRYTSKFTEVTVQSNGRLEIQFFPQEPISLEGMVMDFDYGFDWLDGEITWHPEEWEIKLGTCLEPISFGLHTRAYVTTAHTVGQYHGIIEIHFIFDQ